MLYHSLFNVMDKIIHAAIIGSVNSWLYVIKVKIVYLVHKNGIKDREYMQTINTFT